MTDEPKAPPGYYPDAVNPELEQYWDGQTWTDKRRPKPSAGAEAAPGYYPDAVNPELEQYWDGERWTDKRRARADTDDEGEPQDRPRPKGFYPDPEDETHERFWNGTEWTEQRRAVRKNRSWVPWAIVAGIVVLILMIANGGEDDDGGDESGESKAAPAYTQPKVQGQCPGPLLAGLTDYGEYRVTTNEDWPVMYVSVFDGDDLVDAASLNGAPGEEADVPSIETYALNGGAEKGKTQTVKLALLGVEAEKTELSVQIWGGPEGRRSPPYSGDLYSCDVTVLP